MQLLPPFASWSTSRNSTCFIEISTFSARERFWNRWWTVRTTTTWRRMWLRSHGSNASSAPRLNAETGRDRRNWRTAPFAPARRHRRMPNWWSWAKKSTKVLPRSSSIRSRRGFTCSLAARRRNCWSCGPKQSRHSPRSNAPIRRRKIFTHAGAPMSRRSRSKPESINRAT